MNISGAPDISSTYLYCGLIGDVNISEVNVLNINTADLKARNIYDFDEINFNIPASVKDGATLLPLTEGSIDLSSTKVNANISGDTINLISNENGLPTSGTVSRGTDRIIDWLPPKELKEAVI